MSGGLHIPVRVSRIEPVADRIKRFRFERTDGGAMPVFSGGAHIIVSMNDAGHLRRNPYSLVSPPHDTSGYEISVLRTLDSRGGSAFMHESLKEGDEMAISYPVNLFHADRRGRKHIMIAGGIGVTPFLAMMAEFDREDIPFELHYSMRSREGGAFWKALTERYGTRRIKLSFDEDGTLLPIADILENQPLGTHLYVCGPAPMIDFVLKSAEKAGWPGSNVHSERFLAPIAGTPFDVTLTRSQKVVRVGNHESILEAVEAAGVDAPYMCRGGACGQCETAVAACDGTLLHHDIYLTEDEKKAGRKIMICVSRFEGRSIALDL